MQLTVKDQLNMLSLAYFELFRDGGKPNEVQLRFFINRFNNDLKKERKEKRI